MTRKVREIARGDVRRVYAYLFVAYLSYPELVDLHVQGCSSVHLLE